ncbi:hypothetical protein [Streptomyces alboflavus]|uniref:hypothetical protein n=1 Tax=Streptomyces alboflavus TaxID=67267 RepID=UPI00195F7C7E|nr:hypothetical protein [Streptomyces alboflavus]
MTTDDTPISAVEALIAFARRVVDDEAARALIDEVTRELTGRTVVRPDQHLVPLRFTLRRRLDVSGLSGVGDVADGVLWPDGTASVRWRGEHPSAVFWDRGRVSVEFVHGHQGASEIEFTDQDGEAPAPLDEPALAPAAAPLALRRVVEIALNKPVPCPDCRRTLPCRCVAKRTDGRIDSVLSALAPWLTTRNEDAA